MLVAVQAWWWPLPLRAADPVEVGRVLDDGTPARARYFAGRADRPAVLLLHDFLDTGHNLITHVLGRRLAREGVDLLAPTLTYGIGARREPLPCAALHPHFLEQDVREIQGWVDWLLARGRQRIVLMSRGHGAWPVLALLQRAASGAVRGLVMIGPPPPRDAQLAALRAAAGQGRRDLRQQPLWQCERYVAPADALLSYARWDVPQALEALAATRVPRRAVVAGGDRALDGAWLARLAQAGVSVHPAPAAADLADPAHVDDLVEMLLAALIIGG